MNKCIFIGNLTRDPEKLTSQNNKSICKFSIAVSRDYVNENGNRETDFFNIKVFNALADACANHLKKGNKVAVMGSIQNETYEGQDGEKKTYVNMIARDVEFLTPKNQERKEQEERPKLEETDDGLLPF